MTTAERMAVALEAMASRLEDPDEGLAMRVAELEGLIQQVVTLIQKPDSTNDEWVDLLDELKDALGLSTRVEVT